MKHRPSPPEQYDLLRPRLVDLIDQRHEPVMLSALIDWDFFEREWAGFFPSTTGRPATSPRLVAGEMVAWIEGGWTSAVGQSLEGARAGLLRAGGQQ